MEPPRPPKGRGQMIAVLLAAKKAMELKASGSPVGGQQSDEAPVEIPKARGRAAYLSMIKEKISVTPGKSKMKSSVTEQSSRVVDEPEIVKAEELASESEDFSDPKVLELYQGSSGTQVPMQANYIRLLIEPNKGVFEYHVSFNPGIDSLDMRKRVLRLNAASVGPVRMFDGSTLFLPDKLDETTVECVHPIEQQQSCYEDSIRKTRVMYVLEYKLFGRGFFDPRSVIMVPEHRMEVLPGYVVAVNELSGGLLACLDTQHRVLRCETALDIINRIKNSDSSNITRIAQHALHGAVVLTKYNNNTYRVDDIDWNATPKSTFQTSAGPITYMDYYYKQYGILIKNETQPLLVHVKKVREAQVSKEVDKIIYLVPELCHITGLTDEMRKDFKVVKDIALHTKLTPLKRSHALRTYLENVRNSAEATKIFRDWGIVLQDSIIDINVRVLAPEKIIFGNQRAIVTDVNCNWTNHLAKNVCTSSVDILKWAIIHTAQSHKVAEEFSVNMVRLSSTLGCRVAPAQLYKCANEQVQPFVTAIRDVVSRNVQLIVFIVSSQRDDLYSTIKKMTLVQNPVASQVVLSRNLSNVKKSRAVTLKLALQINCKLGGTLWGMTIPCRDWLIIGIDVFHSPKQKYSYVAFVGNINDTFTRWHTQVKQQGSEMSNTLSLCLMKLLTVWQNVFGANPKHIIVFRDSVGVGNFARCKAHEVQQLEDTLKKMSISATLTMIIVEKRINTRLINPRGSDGGNAVPGTIVDHTITHLKYPNFYLCPQKVTEGTATPTHYVILSNPAKHKADILQRLSFKLCHMYYNWSGTIRIPAPCQYAHKAAGLVGEYIGMLPDESLMNLLYYL